jgi:two-component system LytT family response regulator
MDEPRVSGGESVRVLIVDDEALARQRVRRLLQNEADVEIVGEAETGREAVEMIRQLKPDLVCLDVQMPELDGFGVLEALDGETVPMVLFITAYDELAQSVGRIAVDHVFAGRRDRFRGV